jgi:uncharacterized membrane protein YeaQ/YmgE (transglycosylase-associated protein family)
MHGSAIFRIAGGDSRFRKRKGKTMGLLAWIVVGLVAGFLASRVMKGRGSGLIGDLVLGVVGALLGGFLASALLKIPNAVNGINVTSILVAFLGALIVVALLRAISGRRRIF